MNAKIAKEGDEAKRTEAEKMHTDFLRQFGPLADLFFVLNAISEEEMALVARLMGKVTDGEVVERCFAKSDVVLRLVAAQRRLFLASEDAKKNCDTKKSCRLEVLITVLEELIYIAKKDCTNGWAQRGPPYELRYDTVEGLLLVTNPIKERQTQNVRPSSIVGFEVH